ncbi:MAG: hypothetical protein QG608_2219 [Actinomycetota bacterium]|nr:hypothetical protein [Actinomycetota bacterium]
MFFSRFSSRGPRDFCGVRGVDGTGRARGRRGRGALVPPAVLACTVGTVLLVAPTADADVVGCGDRINADLVLQTNLVCDGPGLIVAADGLTIDLGGHTITGNGTGIGVGLADIAQTLTVVNGTIQRFDTALRPNLWHSTGLEVRGLTLQDSTVGIDADGSWGGVKIVDSVLRRNTRTAVMGAGNHVRVENSRLEDNNAGIVTYTNAGTSAVSSVFVRNTVALRTGNGGVDAIGNRFLDNTTGISASLSGLGLRGNTFVGGGIAVHGTLNIFGIEARDNTFARAQTGLLLEDVQLSTGRIEIANNTFLANRQNGLRIRMGGVGTGVRITGNTFRYNGFAPGDPDDSGQVFDSGALATVGTFTDNLAVGNAGHGIEGHDAVVDGGGNRARANGRTPQCLGVVCTG